MPNWLTSDQVSFFDWLRILFEELGQAHPLVLFLLLLHLMNHLPHLLALLRSFPGEFPNSRLDLGEKLGTLHAGDTLRDIGLR